MNNQLRTFTIEITTSALCNLSCTYCFEGEKTDKRRLDDKYDVVVKRIYEMLDSGWFNTNYDRLGLSFWGGEPTLNQKLIIDLIHEFKNVEEIKFHLYTNGYDRRRLESITDLVPAEKLAVQISYDGKNVTDEYRILKTGKSSADKVLSNIYYFSDKNIDLSLKSTIPLKSVDHILSTWEDFEKIYYDLNNKNKNTSVSYAPTIDYIDMMEKEESEYVLRRFEEEFTKVARKEIEFYQKNGHFLCTWFGSSDNRVTCSAGSDMVAIDVDGQSYACHGALYTEDKKDLTSSDILNDEFVNQVIAYCDNVKSLGFNKKIPSTCVDCVATTCTICPVASHEISKNGDFESKWGDRWVTEMCGFYKPFGKIDRAVQKYLGV
jgi:sulfatase maturation enzyme AslB (radical SAM superfamily)